MLHLLGNHAAKLLARTGCFAQLKFFSLCRRTNLLGTGQEIAYFSRAAYIQPELIFFDPFKAHSQQILHRTLFKLKLNLVYVLFSIWRADMTNIQTDFNLAVFILNDT